MRQPGQPASAGTVTLRTIDAVMSLHEATRSDLSERVPTPRYGVNDGVLLERWLLAALRICGDIAQASGRDPVTLYLLVSHGKRVDTVSGAPGRNTDVLAAARRCLRPGSSTGGSGAFNEFDAFGSDPVFVHGVRVHFAHGVPGVFEVLVDSGRGDSGDEMVATFWAPHPQDWCALPRVDELDADGCYRALQTFRTLREIDEFPYGDALRAAVSLTV